MAGRAARVLRLRNQWVSVDPSDWRQRNDMTVTVGLGTGNKDQTLAHLQSILGMQVQAIQMQGGVAGPIVTLPNVHKTLCEIAKNAGFRNPGDFFSDPTSLAGASFAGKPAATRPEDGRGGGRLRIEQQRAEFDQQHQAAVATADQQHQAMKAAAEHQREIDRLQADTAAAAAKAQLDRELALKIERIKSATAIEVARIRMTDVRDQGSS